MSEVAVTRQWCSRRGTIDDRDAIAALHVDVWRATYRDLAPAAAYEALDEARRATHWEVLLHRDPTRSVTLVVEDVGGKIVAFGHGAPGEHDVMRNAGEIVHLYVHPSWSGLGIGRLLVKELLQFLHGSGLGVVRLAVVDGNERAISFYERSGGQCVGTFVDGVLWRSKNVIYEWNFPATDAAPVTEI